MTQSDIGLDVQKGLWYLEGKTDNRIYLGVQLVSNGNINLENVMTDTYSWGAEKGEKIDTSHGRLRIYDGNQCTIKRDHAVADEIDIKGQSNGFFFKELQKANEDMTIKYVIPKMEWTIKIGKEFLVTKNIAGNISGTVIDKDKTFRVTKPKSVLYSQLITIVNSPLRVK